MDLRAQATTAKADHALRWDDLEMVLQNLLVPAQGDPEMWAVCMKVQYYAIYLRCLTVSSPSSKATSFCR